PDPAGFATALRACVPDAADYDACISDRIAAWWPTAPQAHGETELLGDRCKLAWEQLTPTDNPEVRDCDGCKQSVVRVRSLAAVLPLVGQRCIHVPRS
ncbi:MAG: hypothetical protein H0T79_17215, partial [Deltaproteobacteria bacterium]|nr:hypothetical protein [Deltaproteobacteria bacterium]